MSFLSPFFLVALAASAIPVIIHIINFRKPKKIAFSTLAFFEELQKSTIRRLNLKRYLLLAMRFMAVAMLAAALARPFLPSDIAGIFGSTQQNQPVAILIDNGPSMMQIDESGPFIEQARIAAEQIIRQSSDEARFLLVPTHGEVETGRLMGKAESLRFLENFESVNRGGFLYERMAFVQEIMDEQPSGGRIYWISDARKTQLEMLKGGFREGTGSRSWNPVTFIKVGGKAARNVSVTGVKLQGQVPGIGHPTGVTVTVKNFGDRAMHNLWLSLQVDGERIGQYELTLDAEQQKEFLFEIIPEKTGVIQGKAILEGGTYTFDHTRYFAIRIPESRSILLVTDEGDDGTRRSYLRPVLAAASETGKRIKVSFSDVGSLRMHDLDSYDAIILESIQSIPEYLEAELVQYVQQGRGLFFVPSEMGSIQDYNRFLNLFDAGSYTGMRGTYGRFEEVASIQPFREGDLLIEEIFEFTEDETARIDLPAIYHFWRYNSGDARRGTTLLRSNLGDALFTEHLFGDGMILVGTMGFGPGWSNLGVKPIYAPLIFRMLLHVSAWEYGGVSEHILGLPFDRHFSNFGLRSVMRLNEEEIHPETAFSAGGLRIRYPAREWAPGWLEVELEEGIVHSVIAVNQNILESDFGSLSIEEAKNFLADLLPVAGAISVSGQSDLEMRSAMASVSFGREIWNWFIILAFAFMIAECIISRWYKTETFAE